MYNECWMSRFKYPPNIWYLSCPYNIQGVPQNMTVGEYFKISSSIICLVVWYQRDEWNISYGSHILVKLIS